MRSSVCDSAVQVGVSNHAKSNLSCSESNYLHGKINFLLKVPQNDHSSSDMSYPIE